MPTNTQRWLHLSGAVTLFFLLVGAYFLTFRGFPLSQDEFFIFDSTESLVRRGSFYRTYEFYKFNDGAGDVPWGDPLQEPLASITLAPLFWLGQNLDSIGTMHVAWLYNIFITALTATSVYAGALMLGYAFRTAWLAALLFGLTTLAWPYSRHLFREPLMTLFVFWCVIFALKAQNGWSTGRIAWRWMALLALSFIAAFLTKAISIVLLPALLILLLPPLHIFKTQRRLVIGLGTAGILLVLAILVILSIDTVRERYSLDFWLRELRRVELSYVIESFLGYQVSFSRSIWLHSPVLLMGPPGAWMLWKKGQWRLVAGLAVFVVALSSSYAVAHRVSWWGSWGWGPRYMLPLIPVLMVWVFPILEEALTGWRRITIGVLAAFGVVLHLLGMAVPLPNYYTDLNRAGLLVDWATETQWGAYNWTWQWSPLRYHIERLDFNHLDFAWAFADPGWLGPLLALILVLLSSFALGWVVRGRPVTRIHTGIGSAVLLVIAAGVMFISLRTLRADERYITEFEDVYALAQQLDHVVSDDAAVFIDRDQYLLIFMNSFKTPALTVNLPYSPGENYGAAGPEIMTDDLIEQIGDITAYALSWTGDHYDDAWLVASSSPFETDKLRPVERYMTQRFYPIAEFQTSPRARAIHFLLVSAGQIVESAYTDIIFDERLSLEGYNLPVEPFFVPGDVVPITLSWIPLDNLPEDYNISVQVATLDGFPLAQRDGQPQATFGRMSQWQTGERYLDNHGIQLPPDIVPGEYVIQVLVYRWQDGQRLTYSDSEASGDVAQLVPITVRN